ncbi:hypothetical protein GCM10009616_09750 [Microlunatus lacustris]
MVSLSATDRLSPSCCDPSRRVVSKTWNSAGFGLSWANIVGSLEVVGDGLGALVRERKNLPYEDRRLSALTKSAAR